LGAKCVFEASQSRLVIIVPLSVWWRPVIICWRQGRTDRGGEGSQCSGCRMTGGAEKSQKCCKNVIVCTRSVHVLAEKTAILCIARMSFVTFWPAFEFCVVVNNRCGLYLVMSPSAVRSVNNVWMCLLLLLVTWSLRVVISCHPPERANQLCGTSCFLSRRQLHWQRKRVSWEPGLWTVKTVSFCVECRWSFHSTPYSTRLLTLPLGGILAIILKCCENLPCSFYYGVTFLVLFCACLLLLIQLRMAEYRNWIFCLRLWSHRKLVI